MSPQARLLRFAGGLALVLLGVVIFFMSDTYDPHNRLAVVSIVALVIGGSLTSQGLRGRHDGPLYKEEPTDAGPAVDTNRTLLALALGWAIPGLGHFSIGRKKKAILYFVVVTLTFAIGIALAEGRNMSYARDKIYFYAYMFNGVETGLGWSFFKDLALDKKIPFLQVGFLYSAVAALLNVVVLMDLLATCTRKHAPEIEGASLATGGEGPE
jgi:TM2 domain-containing membrane protein YozV